MQALRKEDLFKSPGVAETLDWATALTELDAVALDPATVSDTLGVLLKYQDDIARIEGSKAERAARPGARGAARRRSRVVATSQAERPPSDRLAENIVYFARALRTAGMPVGPGSVLDAPRGRAAPPVSATREDFYWTLHAVFVKRHEHSVLFDQAFRIFFRKRGYLDKLHRPRCCRRSPPGEWQKAPPAAQRIHDALFGGMNEQKRRKSARSRSTRG